MCNFILSSIKLGTITRKKILVIVFHVPANKYWVTSNAKFKNEINLHFHRNNLHFRMLLWQAYAECKFEQFKIWIPSKLIQCCSISRWLELTIKLMDQCVLTHSLNWDGSRDISRIFILVVRAYRRLWLDFLWVSYSLLILNRSIFLFHQKLNYTFSIKAVGANNFRQFIQLTNVDLCTVFEDISKLPFYVEEFRKINETFSGVLHKCPYTVKNEKKRLQKAIPGDFLISRFLVDQTLQRDKWWRLESKGWTQW